MSTYPPVWKGIFREPFISYIMNLMNTQRKLPPVKKVTVFRGKESVRAKLLLGCNIVKQVRNFHLWL